MTPRFGRGAESVSLPAVLTESELNVAPVPATVETGPHLLAVPVSAKAERHRHSADILTILCYRDYRGGADRLIHAAAVLGLLNCTD